MRNRVFLLLLAILAIGSFLRLYGLSRESLWIDELYSWKAGSYASIIEVINKSVLVEIHPPGYHIVIHFTEKLLGDSKFALRLPSAICGIGSVLLIYLLGQRLFGPREGLLAAGLMAILYCPIYYSQEARVYSMLLFFSLLASILWTDILTAFEKNRGGSRIIQVVYTLVSIIICYLHYFGVYLVMIQAIITAILFFRRPRILAHISLPYIAIFTAFAIWLPHLSYQLQHNMYTVAWMKAPKADAFLRYLYFAFAGYIYASMISAVVSVGILSLYGNLLIKTFRLSTGRKWLGRLRTFALLPEGILALWLFMGFLGIFVGSYILWKSLPERALIIFLPPTYLLFARAIIIIAPRIRTQIIISGVILLASVGNLFLRIEYYHRPQKEQLKQAVSFVTDRDEEYENSLIVGSRWAVEKHWPYADMYNYYLKRSGSARRVDLIGGLPEDIPKLHSTLKKTKPMHVWIISVHEPPESTFLQSLEDNYQCIQQVGFYKSNVWLFVRKTTPI